VELVSLDGVVGSPDGWAFSYSDAEMEAANAAGMAASDALLLGRVTYEEFAAFWPNQPGGTPMVDYINDVAKFVVSKSPSVGTTRLLSGRTSRRGWPT